MVALPTLLSKIIEAQPHHKEMQVRLTMMATQNLSNWSFRSDGGFRFEGRICLLDSRDVKEEYSLRDASFMVYNTSM